MRVSGRFWLRAAAALVALLAVAVWLSLHRHAKAPAGKKIEDRALTSPLNQPGGGRLPDEDYEVYSALYQAPMPEPLMFAERSVTDIPQLDGSCLRPKTAEERELVEAFEAANGQTHPWEARFAIPQGYRVLSRRETAEALACLDSHGQDATRCEPYRKLRHVRFLGVPGFDRTHTRALVSVVKDCGTDCGSGGIFEVEKAGGSWQRAPASDFTRQCSWMYWK